MVFNNCGLYKYNENLKVLHLTLSNLINFNFLHNFLLLQLSDVLEGVLMAMWFIVLEYPHTDQLNNRFSVFNRNRAKQTAGEYQDSVKQLSVLKLYVSIFPLKKNQ